jgi:hypothetical protein
LTAALRARTTLAQQEEAGRRPFGGAQERSERAAVADTVKKELRPGQHAQPALQLVAECTDQLRASLIV